MATAATFPIGHQFFPEESFSSFVALEKPPLVVGDRVVWLGDDEPEHATVRWLGILPEICKGWTAGIEFDNPVGGIDGNWGGQRLFTCKEKHGMIIGLSGLIKEEDFLGNGPVDTSTVPTDVTSVYVVDEEVTIKSGRSNTSNKTHGGETMTFKTEAIKETVELKNEGDRNIEKFLSAKYNPRCAGSFDRRVYARMFAECEVEKWYEVLNYCQEGDDTSNSLDTTLNKDQKQEHALFFNKLKELPIERNVHRQETKKKERGGIFRFFRWLRRNKSKSSSSSTGGGHGPGARRTLSTIRMSDSGRGKAKSLDSVTSLSQSFHYIPVGVVSSEGDLNRCETPPFKERVYEDVDHHCTPQASPAKLPKCLSLSRGVITEGMESRDDVCKERLQHGSVRSAFSSNSVSLSFVKKKRRAPLPPLTNSAPAPGSNWVKGIPLMNETNDLPRSSSAFSSPQVSSGRLQRNPTASSTGAICKRLPDEEGTRTVSYPSDMYSKFKHKRSVSLTTADIPAPFTTNPTAKHQRVGSHVKNKRKAPAPPSPGVTRNEPLSKPSVSADHPEVSNQIASKREAEGQETKSKSTSTTSLTNNHANKSQSSASHIEDGLTRGVKKDVAEVPPILPEKTKCKPLAKPTNDNFIFREPQKRMHSSMYVTNEDNVQKSGSGKSSEHFDDTRSHQTHMKDKVFQGNRETFKEKEPEQATNLDMEKKKPENCELPHKPHRRTSKTSSSSSNSSPSTSKLKNLNIDENIGGDFPQQESQMNIEALQNLVESLVVLYCGNNQKKDENPNYINVNCGNTEPKLFESGFENETGLSGKKTTKHRATDSGCQMIKLKSGHPVIDSNDTWVKSVRTRCPVAATDVSDCTVSTSNGEPEGCDDGDDIDDPGERARSPLTSTSNDQEEDGNNDDVVDSDFANELLERWQTRMREQLLNMDLNVHEDKHRLSEKLLLNNIKEVDAGDDVGSGIYEPIGNFIYSPNMECKSQIAAGDNVVISDQHTDGNSCKNRENEHHSRSEACNSVPRSFQHGGRRVTEPSDIRSEIEQNDVCKDPFSFWRDLCARESLDERRATQDVSRRKCSEDLIRRLSVNGHWQSMKNNSDDDQGIQNENSIAKNEDRSICADSKSSKASRTPDFYSEKERDFHYYENTFTATPHRVVVVDGITIRPEFTTCSPAVPAYWPPAPLMAYGHLPQQQQHHHQQQQHCSHFPALAIVPLSSAIPQQVFASRPFSGGGFVMTSAPSRVTTLGIPNVPTDATHDPGGPYANRQTERMVTNPPIAKRLTQNPISQDVYQNRGGEYHKQKSNEKRQQSPIVISDEEDTDEDEESSDSSGKRTYANVWHRCSRGTGQDKNTYANVPPPSPSSSQKRENRRGCSSSRLSANCNWLKESSKTVEAKIKAAQDGSSPVVVGDSGEHSGSQPSQNPTSTTAFRSLVTRKDGDALAVASKPPPHPSKAQESTVSSNIELQVVAQAKTASPSVFHLDKSNNGKRRELTRVVHSIESLARETFLSLMDYCVIIGGVKVATPFRLWPLEYELVAPELEKLEGLLNGNAPTEDLLSASSLNSDVDCLAVSKLLKKLENAISGGKADEAAILARDLAFLKIQCLVVLNRKPKEDQHPAPIVVHLFVEDKVSHHGPIPIKIVPSITVGELKKQILHEFEFPIALQRWIIGRKLATDDDTKLSALGVEADGCPVFLYLLSVEDLGVKSKDLVWENGDSTPSDIPSKPKRCKKVVKKRQSRDVMDMNVKNPVRDSIDERDEETNATTAYLGWQCEGCTMINKPTRPGCAMCGSDRPSTYVIPSNYKLSDDELKRIEQEEAQEKALREAENLQRLQNWQLYLDLDDQAIIYNNEVFECSVCFTETQPGQGVQLRDCLHSFCCDCLRNAITHCEDAEVRCLYRDDQYSCDSVLQEREIRALVSEDVLERLLQRSMARAESQAKNSFHCKTPDCQGWCLFEDNANEFLCPVCMRLNCITCRAIHEQLNCRQYQDRLMMLARTDEEAKKTTDAIEVMLQRGEALRCPSCQVIIMKKWGCDWLSCSVCKTEICWVTKGPRWGPMGRGDVSAGCKCGVKGIKCHPNCNYCH